MHSDPKTKAEFDARYDENACIRGEGMETEISLPCPFCAAPDFVVFRMLDAEMIAKLEKVCSGCQRGVVLEVKPIKKNTGVRWEFVQTCGEDPPAYLPEMRRASTGKGGDA